MRRLILGSFLAAGLALPAAALAKQANGLNTNQPINNAPQNGASIGRDRLPRPQANPANGPNGGISTLGGAPMNGNDPGHVDSPGTTKIDPDSRGPVNDVQPGRGTDDTPQSANPPPIR
jgi:hypothetical protein